MDFKLAIFPYKAKFYSTLIMLVALVMAYFYLKGSRPEILVVPVFSIVSSYLETRYFVFAQTNLLDEMAAILFILGIVVFSFSKAKIEYSEYNILRVKALFYSFFITLLFWVLSFLLIYGMAIFVVSSFVFIIYLINYNLLLYCFIFQFKKSEKLHSKC